MLFVRSERSALRLHTHPFSLSINGIELERTRMFTFLGVVIDDKLCWDDHVDKVRREIAPYVFILYKIRPFVSEKTCWLIYNAYIASRLMYIAPAWRTATKTQTEHVGGSTAIGPEDN